MRDEPSKDLRNFALITPFAELTICDTSSVPPPSDRILTSAVTPPVPWLGTHLAMLDLRPRDLRNWDQGQWKGSRTCTRSIPPHLKK
jgi:hypothetical protein